MPLLNTHSEELQEIMGRIPSRVVRWGTGVIFAILAIILLLSWLVKYPEMVSAPITITTENSRIVGKMALQSERLGKVEVGQEVHVKLKSYPYIEFGILKGEIINIYADTTATGYAADIYFSNGLVSSYNKKLKLFQQMDGTADIVTRDMRLIERFFAPVRNVIQNN